MPATATQPETDYLLRKLHSLTGIIPVGAFLAEHFWSNSYALVSRLAIRREITGVADDSVPLGRGMAVHFLADALSRRIWDLYLASREVQCVGVSVGGKLAIHYAALHGTDCVCLHWMAFVHRALADAWPKSTYSDVEDLLQNPYALTFMFVGVLASSFHLGVGIWNFLCKWGLAATVKAQRAAGAFGAMVGFAFSLVGVLIVLSFWLNWHPFDFYLK